MKDSGVVDAAAAAAAVVAAAVFLAACTGSLFQSKSPPTSVYQLSFKSPGIPAGQSAFVPAVPPSPPDDLALLRPHVRTGLDSDHIALLQPDRRLDYFAAARWSGPLDRVVQDLGLQALRAQAHLRNVTGDASAFTSGFWLELEVTDFQAEYAPAGGAPTVHVRLLARLGAAGDRRIIGTYEADALQPAGGNRLSAIVDAYQTAADAALGQVAAAAAQTLASEVR